MFGAVGKISHRLLNTFLVSEGYPIPLCVGSLLSSTEVDQYFPADKPDNLGIFLRSPRILAAFWRCFPTYRFDKH